MRHRREATIACGLALALLALLVALNLLQWTTPDLAHRSLRRAVATLTETDSLLAAHGDALRQQAAASPDQPASLPDFPIEVSLSPQEAQQPLTEVRELVLDRSADQVYQEGPAAFREEGQPGTSERFSPQGAVDAGLGFLTASRHDSLRWATVALALVCGALSGVLVLLARGYGRLMALGGTVAAASALFLLAAAAVRFVLALAGWASDDYVTVQLLDLAKGTAWLPVLDGLAFGGLGLALLALGLLGSRLSQPSEV